MSEQVPDEYFDQLLGSSVSPSVLPGLFSLTEGAQILSDALHKAQKRVRVAACKAELVAEAPAARATRDVRIAGSKSETIEPKAAGNIDGGKLTLAEKITAIQLDAAEKAEHLIARHMKKPPGQADTFRAWAKIVYERHNDGNGVSKRQLMRDYHCAMRLIDRALYTHTRLTAKVAA